MAEIEFPPQERGDARRHAIVFPARIEEGQVECAISYHALWLYFGADYDNPRPTFIAHRKRIEQLAAQCISHARFESDGTVMIRLQDIT